MKRLMIFTTVAAVLLFGAVIARAVGVVGQGEKTVTGTAAVISATSLECTMLTLVADDGAATNGNNGIIYVGKSDVSTSNGFPIRPGGAYNIPVNFETGVVNPSEIYVVASDSSEKLRWLCWN